MSKKKVSVAIPEPSDKWLRAMCRKTGESFSALVTRILIEAQSREAK